MKKYTLRELLNAVAANTFVEVFDYLHKVKELSSPAEAKRSYINVILNLISLPKTKRYKYTINVAKIHSICNDEFDYISVRLINEKAIDPPKGKSPFGCLKGQKAPKGFYDVNLEKYNKNYSLAFTSWNNIIDTPIIVEKELKNNTLSSILAEILWELTYYGFDEESMEQYFEEMEESFLSAQKEIEEGKYIKLPKKSKKEFDIVIPNSIVEKLKKLK